MDAYTYRREGRGFRGPSGNAGEGLDQVPCSASHSQAHVALVHELGMALGTDDGVGAIDVHQLIEAPGLVAPGGVLWVVQVVRPHAYLDGSRIRELKLPPAGIAQLRAQGLREGQLVLRDSDAAVLALASARQELR
eukprot:COSAG02_NODE_5586_length_4209_cov_2.219951_6_plen_136_part_00